MNDFQDRLHDAFLRLFTSHEPALRAFVRSLVPTSTDANDVMQETAIVLWRKFGEYDPRREFRGWAFGIAKMQVLTWQRDRARDRHLFGEELVEILAGDAARQSDLLEKQRDALRICLETLPFEHRTLVSAAYASGTRINELAATLRQSVAALYKRLHRIRLALVECTRRQLLKEHGA
jgi:RNA polymerase sigma-70 factor (ECF subfamily)